jgi:hypothetical protein
MLHTKKKGQKLERTESYYTTHKKERTKMGENREIP